MKAHIRGKKKESSIVPNETTPSMTDVNNEDKKKSMKNKDHQRAALPFKQQSSPYSPHDSTPWEQY